MPLGDVLHHVVGAVDAVHPLGAADDPLVRLDLDEQAVLAADQAAPDAGDPQLGGTRRAWRAVDGRREARERAGEDGPGGGARGAPGQERAARLSIGHLEPPHHVRCFSSSWICSRGTGSLSMWSVSHFEKSFSIGSLQRWSIWPGV